MSSPRAIPYALPTGPLCAAGSAIGRWRQRGRLRCRCRRQRGRSH